MKVQVLIKGFLLMLPFWVWVAVMLFVKEARNVFVGGLVFLVMIGIVNAISH